MRRLALALVPAFALLLLAAPPPTTRADDEGAEGAEGVLVTEDYKAEDVRKVIRDIAMKAKANVIVSPDVHGIFTGDFRNCRFEGARMDHFPVWLL